MHITATAVLGVMVMMSMTVDTLAADDYLPMPADGWQLVTDDVMGGVSMGAMQRAEREGKACTVLNGDVSTDNNGGFIQIVMNIDESLAVRAAEYDGVRFHVHGNGEPYNLHLRTRDLWFPWQAYRSTFETISEWQQIDLPFDKFKAYKTSTQLDVSRLKRLGVVAIGRNFTADICVGSLGFYRL